MLMLLTILVGATVAIAVTVKHQRRECAEPSVQQFAGFLATLAATEHPDRATRN